MSRLLSVTEAAAMLGIQPRTLREFAYERRIGCVRIGKLYRFKPEQLEQFVKQREQAPVPERKLKAVG